APFTDHELFSAMDRENRERADLSAFEQGTMYRRALDAGLYPSNRRLAEALGVSHTWVANVLLVADLPPPVIECFRTPIEIQHR
ncbi:TyrR/PhhR family helix-turn-helix DNA-binding protein, partial [Acinetobacter baumannii]